MFCDLRSLAAFFGSSDDAALAAAIGNAVELAQR